MPLFRPSELLSFLKSIDSSPSKRLSQNFLIDQNVMEKITELARLEPGDLVLEVGPGPGALTEHLLKKGGVVYAVEKDRQLGRSLNRLQTEDRRLHVFTEDILQFNLQRELSPLLESGKKYKLIANLPYRIANQILTRFIPLHQYFTSIVIMVQKEVAERYLAPPSDAAYGSLTLYLQFFATPIRGFTVRPNSFFPKPTVHSSVVRFDLHPPVTELNQKEFFQFTRLAFSKRRKQIANGLREKFSPSEVRKHLTALGHKETARPQELSLRHYIQLFNALVKRSPQEG